MDLEQNDRQKKGLLIVYDPHNLYQFLWYFCTNGKDTLWDALCLPNEGKGTYMDEYCEKVGIFEKIFRDETEYTHMDMKNKIGVFLKMLHYALRHKQKEYARELLNGFVDDIDAYERIVVLTDVGMVSGICLLFGDEKEVTILEDGVADYVTRKNSNIIKNITNLYDWQGFLTAQMGYSNVGHRYPLASTKYCHKYCSNPQYMTYRNYKDINKLFDMKNTDIELFDELILKLYPEVANIQMENVDTIVFSATIQSFSDKYSVYVEKIQNYLSNICQHILLKKHPRDLINYDFGDGVEVIEIPASIPAEVLLRYAKGKRIVFCSFSATLFYTDSRENEIEIIYLENLHDECVKNGSYLVYDSLETIKSHLQEIHMEDVHIAIL